MWRLSYHLNHQIVYKDHVQSQSSAWNQIKLPFSTLWLTQTWRWPWQMSTWPGWESGNRLGSKLRSFRHTWLLVSPRDPRASHGHPYLSQPGPTTIPRVNTTSWHHDTSFLQISYFGNFGMWCCLLRNPDDPFITRVNTIPLGLALWSKFLSLCRYDHYIALTKHLFKKKCRLDTQLQYKILNLFQQILQGFWIWILIIISAYFHYDHHLSQDNVWQPPSTFKGGRRTKKWNQHFPQNSFHFAANIFCSMSKSNFHTSAVTSPITLGIFFTEIR